MSRSTPSLAVLTVECIVQLDLFTVQVSKRGQQICQNSTCVKPPYFRTRSSQFKIAEIISAGDHREILSFWTERATMADQQAYDDMFTHIASKAGGIKPLLDTFFSFLERKTDFYVQFDQPAGQVKASYKMGFPKGVAEKMVLQAFRQYKLQDYDAVMGSQSEQPATVPRSAPQTPSKSATPSQSLPAPPSTPPKTPAASQPPRTPTTTSKPSAFTPSYTPEGKQYPIGNGGIGENYYWTQTLKDVTVYIDTAAGCRGKDVKCDIKAQSLKVAIRGEVVVEGALEDVIRTQESLWTISSTTDSALQQIVITLDKTRPTWWKHVISTHEEIDTTKVQNTTVFLTDRRQLALSA